MGGRTVGFLAGVLLVTSTAYYTSAQFRQSQQFASRTLREAEDIINGIEKKKEPVPRVMNFKHRPVKETIADLWDDSVLSAARAVYAVDLEKTGEDAAAWISKRLS